MSYVTNAILSFSNAELDTKEILDKVNKFFEESRGFALVPPCGPNMGGTKCLEDDLAIGAFNHINEDELIDYLKSLDWESGYEDIQLMLKNQDDMGWRIIKIWKYGNNQKNKHLKLVKNDKIRTN